MNELLWDIKNWEMHHQATIIGYALLFAIVLGLLEWGLRK